MIDMRQRKLIFALLALLLILAGCKSESPTAPPIGTGGTGGGGGVTPPTNPTVRIAASNTSPLVNSNVTITATVTENNQNVPNGTAVQFTTSLGTFTDTGANSTIRITNNGQATATLTSAGAGTAHVTATVANVSASVDVTFSTVPVTPPPPSTTPTITGITPSTGPPAGGTQITITGTNFRTPVRVLFDIGDGSPKEAFVASVTPTQIVAITPAINLTTGQTKAADVIVLTQAGTAAEQRVVKTQGFTYQLAVLTPVIRAVQPSSGPIGGGTRVTITGDAFQTPVQVFFGAAEAQVISVTFDTIIAMSPRASDTAPGGSGAVTGPVPVTVKNIGSNTTVTLANAFRYTPKMQITTVGPTEGPFTGGTRIRIDGVGFDDPLAVVVAGVAAQVISVSGTEVIAQTVGLNLSSCGDVQGPIVVTNTENGDSATGPTFIFRVPKPLIVNVSNPNTLNGTAQVTVLNALGFPRILVGGAAANVVSQVANPDGTTTFTVQIPPTLTLTQLACPSGGTAPQPTAFTVQYTSATTGCTDTANNALIVNPPASPVAFANPATYQPFTATITQAAPPAPPFPGTAVTPSATQTVQIVNTGNAPLNITNIATAGAGCGHFTFGPAVPPTITLNQCEALPVGVTYTGQTTPTTETCTLTVTTNGGNKTFLLVGTSQ
jgi:hypothetical protein